MIESITITGIPPFTGAEPVKIDLRKVNYFFGTNGVGKTTISCVIADPASRPTCLVQWKGGQQLKALVLNRDFVDKNFGQLNGIFTLGEEQKGIQEQIAAVVRARDAEQTKRNQLRNMLEGDNGQGGKKAELEQLEHESAEDFWAVLQKYEGEFKDAFTGCRDKKIKFKQRVLVERTSNTATSKPYVELAERAKTVFGDAPVKADAITSIDISALQSREVAPILSKVVVGKEGVDVAAMIERLHSSDWVREGLGYYHENDGNCPFCQQKAPDTLAASLEAYFDESYNSDKQAIDQLFNDYAADAAAVQQALADLLAKPGDFLDVVKLTTQKTLLDEVVRTNALRLKGKQQAPSQPVTLETVSEIATAAAELIAAANIAIDDRNAKVDNLEVEREALTADVWRLVLDELDPLLKSYDKRKNALEQAIESLTLQIADAEAAVTAKGNEIGSLERQTTSVRPTADAINSYLSKFGFDSFKLDVAADGRAYQLVRPNGDLAATTLSEGEKTFVVFLYFYHLLRGSLSASGITDDRVVVFDDPVSSLDSDVLFIVSSLIREVCAEARSDSGHVKQVLVLTHNVYFHHEVAFEGNKGAKKSERLFAVVRKRHGTSSVTAGDDDPIKTSYELLWHEVRHPDGADVRLPNTLRRILEFYFKNLGGEPLDTLADHFESADRLVCRSLLSWANAGSHQILEDLYMVPSDTSTETFLRVFRKIFEETHHEGHYHMMMRDAANGGGVVGAPEANASQTVDQT